MTAVGTRHPAPAKSGVLPVSGAISERAGPDAPAVRVADRVLFSGVLLALAMSPFEASYRPVGRLLLGIFTNLELVLFLMVAAFVFKLAVDKTARGHFVRLPLLVPICALILASVASWLFGEYHDLGAEFTYRLVMGALVYASVSESMRSSRRLLVAVWTVTVVAVISAVTGLLEFAPGFNIDLWLQAFKPQPTTVGGMVRLSGTFEYANGAAGYLEIVIPLVTALAVMLGSWWLLGMVRSPRLTEGKRRSALAACFASIALLVTALILTYSRAAVVCTAIGMGVFGLVALLRARTPSDAWVKPAVWRSLAVVGAVMVLGAASVLATQPGFRLRLTTENDRRWYVFSAQAPRLPVMHAGDSVAVPVTLRNDGQMVWSARGVLPVYLSYHWQNADKSSYVVFEGVRTPLPVDVQPGQSVSLRAVVQAPPSPGDYYLQWDMVYEESTWFSARSGVNGTPVECTVLAGTAQTSTPAAPSPRVDVQSVLNSESATVERADLWRAALAMFLDHPIFGAGPDGFRMLYGKYAGVANWNRNIFTNNTYIEYFTDLGFPGGLAFLWLAALALVRAWRAAVRQPASVQWVLGLGATAALVAFLAHGLLDYFLFATPLYLMFWTVVAVATLPARNDSYATG